MKGKFWSVALAGVCMAVIIEAQEYDSDRLPARVNIGINSYLINGRLEGTTFEQIRQIRRWTIASDGFRDEHFVRFAAMPLLERLSIEGSFNGTGLSQVSFAYLRDLSVSSSPVTDAGVKAIARIKTLQKLQLDQTHITDRGVAELTALSDLRELTIGGDESKITDESMKYIRELRRLEFLEAGGTDISDKGIQYLVGHGNLRALFIGGTRVTDGVFEHLIKIPNLERIGLGHTKIKGNGLALLGQLGKLNELILGQSKVDEDEIVKLLETGKILNHLHLSGLDLGRQTMEAAGKCDCMARLTIADTKIKDADLMKLVPARRLKSVYIARTRITDEGAAEFHSVRPDVVLHKYF